MDDAVRKLQQCYVLVEEGNRRALRGTGLTSSQLVLLGHVARGPDAGLTVSDVAAAQLCTRGNAARLVGRLEEAGLVDTRGDEQDARLVRVVMTAEGRERLAHATNELRRADRRRLRQLGPEGRAALRASLDALARGLSDDLATSA